MADLFYKGKVVGASSNNADNIMYGEQTVGEALRDAESWVQLSREEVIASVDSAVTLSSFEGYRRENRVYVHLYFSGTVATSASGSVKICTISPEFCPKVAQSLLFTLNTASSGQVYDGCHGVVYANGAVWMYTGGISKTYGNTSYPWCTTDGIWLAWDIA